MRDEKHTPSVQAKLRNRDTTIRDGLTKKVDVSKLEENLRRAREAGNGPLLKQPPTENPRPDFDTRVAAKAAREAASMAVVRSKPVAVPKGVKVPGMVSTPNGLVRDTPNTYEVISGKPDDIRRLCNAQYKALEQQILALKDGTGLIWHDAPTTSLTTASGVIYRMGARHGLRLRTFLDQQGRRIVWRGGPR